MSVCAADIFCDLLGGLRELIGLSGVRTVVDVAF